MIVVNGDPMPWSEGMTVRDVLIERNYVFRMLIVRINAGLYPGPGSTPRWCLTGRSGCGSLISGG
jgi:hypothetical protein